MSSRKKLTITLVSVALVVVAAVVSVVAVLAAQTQSVKSTFKIQYSVGKNVIADVSAKYQLMAPQTGAVSGFSGTSIGSGLSIERLDDGTSAHELKGDGDVSVVYCQDASGDQDVTLSSLIFEFKFNNKSAYAYNGTLSLYKSTTKYTDASNLKSKENLVATYWDGDSWKDFLSNGKILEVDALDSPSADPSTTEKTVYVQLQIANLDFDVSDGNATDFTFNWELTISV